MHKAALMLLFGAIAITSDAQQLAGRELEKFLGPVPRSLCEWHKGVDIDSEFFYATANPPLRGTISISMSLWTWQVDLGSIAIGGPDKLGVLNGHWGNLTFEDENHQTQYESQFSFADNDDRKIQVTIISPSESDVQKLAAEVMQLPLFNHDSSSPFDNLMTRKWISRAIDCFVLPSVFFVTLWLTTRGFGKRQVSNARQAVGVAFVSFACLLMLIGLRPFTNQFGPVFNATWNTQYELIWFVTPILAAGSCLIALIVLIYLIIRRLFSGLRVRA